MVTIRLYSKPECGLCQEVKGTLRWLSARYPHELDEIDITQDADLFARYRFSIPVVEIGETRLKAPIDDAELKAALATAVSSQST